MKFNKLKTWLWNQAVDTDHGRNSKARMEEFDKVLYCALNDEWQEGYDMGYKEGGLG